MPAMLTIQLAHRITAARVVDTPVASPVGSAPSSPAARAARDIGGHGQPISGEDGRTQELARLCETVGSIVNQLNRVYDETITGNRREIAALAVEIARKILAAQVARGDYTMQAVIEEALTCAPTRQQVVVRVSPQDLRSCQQLQQDNPDSPLCGLEFVADPALAPADCLVETPKGIVKSFVEERMERVGEALLQVE